ncbi:antitoxin VbhA family protein [Ralstonia mannitolilytica]|uniref:antitoxin VbhA family protein n=1 Tax=Ralstonia mannitolilytica TaxID=105219 RepID=UPI00292CF12A|nr:antitoxin VbhA family protein [Ralstonia mannitolilytica]
MSEKRKPLKSWASRQAVAILAVDNIKVSDFGYDLLRRREEGLITYEQAREKIRERGKELTAKSKLPSPEQIHRVMFGFEANGQDFLAVAFHDESHEFIPLTPDTLKWVSELKRLHKIPVYGYNNRLPWEYKQLWDSWHQDQESVD